MFPLRIDERMFETPGRKNHNQFLKVREMAKEVADDLIIAYGAKYYTPDIVEVEVISLNACL